MSGGLELNVTLTAEQLRDLEARIAARVLEQLQQAASERLLTVDELAEQFATTPSWVRRHQSELGGFRLSKGGGRNPIRFRPSDVEKFLTDHRLRPAARAGHWRDDPDWAVPR